MSGARTGDVVDVRVPTRLHSISPNKQDDAISVHVRTYWPHLATEDELLEAIILAFAEAIPGALKRFKGERASDLPN